VGSPSGAATAHVQATEKQMPQSWSQKGDALAAAAAGKNHLPEIWCNCAKSPAEETLLLTRPKLGDRHCLPSPTAPTYWQHLFFIVFVYNTVSNRPSIFFSTSSSVYHQQVFLWLRALSNDVSKTLQSLHPILSAEEEPPVNPSARPSSH